MFSRLTAHVVKYLRRKQGSPAVTRVRADAAAITVDLEATQPGSPAAAAIPWQDIATIAVFKRSAYAHDVVCMTVESRRRTALEVDETVPGWPQLVEQVSRQLPGSIPVGQWFTDVAFDSVERTPMVIYSDAQRR
jgi:hypothetical protein